MENLNHDEIIAKINKDLPNWLVSIAKDYSKKFPYFIKNWNLMCKRLKTTKKYILIVNQIPHIRDKNADTKIFDYCNNLTKLGYIIRRKQELMLSTNGKAIPTRQMYDYMCKNANLREFMPKTWSDS